MFGRALLAELGRPFSKNDEEDVFRPSQQSRGDRGWRVRRVQIVADRSEDYGHWKRKTQESNHRRHTLRKARRGKESIRHAVMVDDGVQPFTIGGFEILQFRGDVEFAPKIPGQVFVPNITPKEKEIISPEVDEGVFDAINEAANDWLWKISFSRDWDDMYSRNEYAAGYHTRSSQRYLDYDPFDGWFGVDDWDDCDVYDDYPDYPYSLDDENGDDFYSDYTGKESFIDDDEVGEIGVSQKPRASDEAVSFGQMTSVRLHMRRRSKKEEKFLNF